MKKIFAVLMVFLIVFSAFSLSVRGASSQGGLGVNSKSNASLVYTADSGSSGTDWWPMFHHDLNHTGTSTSIGPTTNNTLWSYTTSGPVLASPAVVGGFVYVGSMDNNIYCLNAANGALVWNYTTGKYVGSCPAVVGGFVYVGSDDRKVYCLDAATGSFIWSYKTGDYVVSSPAVVSGLVYVGSLDGNIYCLNATNGASIWNYTTGWRVDSSPAVVGGFVYVGSNDGYVYCLNAANGALVWSRNAVSNVQSSPAVVGGLVYVGSRDGNVYCFNAANGALVWHYGTSDWVFSSPAVADGLVYVGSDDENFYCLNAANGALVWSRNIGYWDKSSPAVVGGLVYVGSFYDNHLYCLNATTGALVWSYKTGSAINSSPAVVNGAVYVGSHDSKVYCFGSNHSPSNPDKPQWADTQQILTSAQSVHFTTSATDLDGDQVRIAYDWGDGTPTWQSNLVPSGTAVTKDHSWSQTGMFLVKAMATDSKGAESGWSSPLEVTVVVRQDATIWSGYCVQHVQNDVTYVEGEWTQPSYDINPFINLFGSTSTWIGIGGVGSGSSLLQAGIGYWGTHEDLLLRMHPFWMTQGPDGRGSFFFDTSKSASVGDFIQASISLSGNNQWTIYIQDLTGTGWVFSATVNCVSDQKTAEWIHEIAGKGSSLIGFSPVAFGEARFTASGTTYRVGDEHSVLRMFYNVTGGVTCTTVSEITNYETFTISDTGNRPASSSTPITSIFGLHSSAEMYVYDSKNRYDGYNVTSGFFDLGIPNSYFFVDDTGTQLAVLFGLDEYRVVLNGTENGDFHLHIESYVNSTENMNLWENGTITIGATRTYYVNTISEFPTSMILPFFLIAILLVALILRRKEAEKSDNSVSQPYAPAEMGAQAGESDIEVASKALFSLKSQLCS